MSIEASSSEIKNSFEFPSGTTVVKIDADQFTIPIAQIGRYSGGSRYKMDEKTERIARNALDLARKRVAPTFGYATWEVTDNDPQRGVRLASGYRLPLPDEEQDSELKGVAAVLCTLGEGLDQAVRDISDGGDLVVCLFMDAAGVAILEALGAACQDHMKEFVKPLGLFCGCPFGPGYGTTPMGSFDEIFQHVDGNAVGVYPSGEAMFKPLKSVAFWLRLTANQNAVTTQKYKCRRCSMENCLYRTASYQAA